MNKGLLLPPLLIMFATSSKSFSVEKSFCRDVEKLSLWDVLAASGRIHS